MTEEGLEIVKDFATYTEVSPSGTGLRIFCRGTMPEDGRKKGNVEFFQAKKYLTLTGNKLSGFPDSLEDRQDRLDALYQRHFAEKVFGIKANEQADHDMFHGTRDGELTDADIIGKASRAVNRRKFSALWAGDTSAYGGDDSAADLALCSMLGFYTGPDPARIDTLFRQSGLYREKWERPDYRERTIGKALEDKTEFFNDKKKTAAVEMEESKQAEQHTDNCSSQQSTDESEKINLTDKGNGQRLVHQFGRDLRHCWPWRKWLSWDGRRWRIDDTGAVVRLAKKTLVSLFKWAVAKMKEIQKALEEMADEQ